MSRHSLLIGLILPLPPWAGAQATDPATRDLIEKLLSRIDGLEKRIAELEKEKTTAVAVTAPPAQPARPAPDTTHMAHDQAPIPEASQPSYPSLKIAGFGVLNFSASNLHGPNRGS